VHFLSDKPNICTVASLNEAREKEIGLVSERWLFKNGSRFWDPPFKWQNPDIVVKKHYVWNVKTWISFKVCKMLCCKLYRRIFTCQSVLFLSPNSYFNLQTHHNVIQINVKYCLNLMCPLFKALLNVITISFVDDRSTVGPLLKRQKWIRIRKLRLR
jgi:hypothetical protein